jgi:hypothetical protein
MRRIILIAGLLVVAGVPVRTVSGMDLTKIDRTIAKEPAYKGKPRYCLLVFGPEAKTRVWVVADVVQDPDVGASIYRLYIDCNGNGDLTERVDRVKFNSAYSRWESGDILGPDGKLRYKVSLRTYKKVDSGVRLSIDEGNKKRYIAGDPDGDPLIFAARPSEAPIVHMGGPLGIDLTYYVQGKVSRSLVLRVRVGTVGLGRGAFAGLVLHDATPVADVEFPSNKPGAPPFTTTKPLKDR